MVEEYRTLAIVFGIIALLLTAYFIKWVVLAPKKPPPPVQSVYIEPLAQPAAPGK
jgi:phage shock protein PspC (stress-responsive transcriptional regulator)